MRVQDFIADETMRAMEAVIHQADRVPADKVEWCPMDEGRSTLDQLQEVAVIASFYPHLLTSFEPPTFDDETMQKFREAKARLDTLEKAETALRENTVAAAEAIRKVPDEKLTEEMAFFGPNPWKVSSIMNAHCWNLHYHTGQICYIQTLLGDKQMG